MSAADEGAARVSILAVGPGGAAPAEDAVAVEEPVEIRLSWVSGGERVARSLSVTMRTPGDDRALAVGFLATEGILPHPGALAGVAHCGPPAPGRATSNVIRVDLAEGIEVDLGRLSRHFYTASSCGVCGKTSLEAVAAQGIQALPAGPLLESDLLGHLPDRLRAVQALFQATGGLHGAALLRPNGALVRHAEDVGRHNAVDKVIGAHLLAGEGFSDTILLVSGRAGFELVQKALVVGIPVFLAVGAPTSLAVELAQAHGQTLVGFLGRSRFNVYAGHGRIAPGDGGEAA